MTRRASAAAQDAAPSTTDEGVEEAPVTIDEHVDVGAMPSYARGLVAHFEGMDEEERAVHEALLERDRRYPLA